MGKIVSIQQYVQEKHMNQQVLPFLRSFYVAFDVFKSNDEALIKVYRNTCLCFFLKYIPKGQYTLLPTLSDRFQEVKFKPRNSVGEWVVEVIYDLEYDRADKIFDKANLVETDLYVNFVKSEIQANI